jgi:hypothetical protein
MRGNKTRPERHFEHLPERAGILSAIGAVAILLASNFDRSIDFPRALPGLVPTVIAFVLAISASWLYTSGEKAQAYRAAIGALFAGCAAALYTSDPSWNVQNVVMGLAVVISIAAIVVPPIRHNQPKAPHRGA